jgi:hypothetical protein
VKKIVKNFFLGNFRKNLGKISERILVKDGRPEGEWEAEKEAGDGQRRASRP